MKKKFSATKGKLIIIRPQNKQNLIKAGDKISSCVKVCRLESLSHNYGQINKPHPDSSNNGFNQQKRQRDKTKTQHFRRSFSCIQMKQLLQNFKVDNQVVEKTHNVELPRSTDLRQQRLRTQISKYITQIKAKAVEMSKDNLYDSSKGNILELLVQFQQKFLLANDNQPNPYTRQTLKNVVKRNRKTLLSIIPALSQQFLVKKPKNIQHDFQVFELLVKIEPKQTEDKIFWSSLKKFQQSQNNPAQLVFLLSRLNYLQDQLQKQRNRLTQLLDKHSHLKTLINEKVSLLAQLEEDIAKKEGVLHEINIKKMEFDSYPSKQSNKLLELHARQYKARQQELFDMAFMFEENLPDKVLPWIGSITNVSDKCFHLNMNQFFSRLSGGSTSFHIERSQLEKFRSNIQFSYNKVTSKLQQIIESRFAKIKEFVTVMQKLASHTVGKREFLNQMNWEMSIAKTRVEKSFEELQKQTDRYNVNNEQFLQKFKCTLKEIRVLVKSIEELYMKAQVLY